MFARPGRYFSVMDGPRMLRLDADNEVVRRRNALVMTAARQVLIANVSPEAATAMRRGWPNCTVANTFEELVPSLRGLVKRPSQTLRWGPSNLGVGLYRARLERKELLPDLESSPQGDTIEKGRHLLVACERGDPHAEILASNLAFGFGASFATFPELPEEEGDVWIEQIYALGDGSDTGVQFQTIASKARAHLGQIDFSRFRMVLFVTSGFPWGIATPEVPTTHMYRYPDFGRAIVEGLWASQSARRSARTALLIDPGTIAGSEIPAVNKALLRNGSLTRVLRDRAATINRVDSVVNLLPHDIIVLSSHAGDAPGERITYEFHDAENRRRRLTVDRALGFGYDGLEDKFQVTEYHRFHSLDGVDWKDKEGKAALPVGSAITTWSAMGGPMARSDHIVSQVAIPRVIGSMGIQLHDGVWFFLSHGFAPGSAPLIINNSCWSWHEISQRVTYAGARAYIGSLVPILGPEAQTIAEAIFGKYLGQPFPLALWSAQRDVYRDSHRRPYVMVGLPCISIRPNHEDSVAFMTKSYLDGIEHWSRREHSSLHEDVRGNARRFSVFLKKDLQDFREHLVRKPHPSR
jgi:hypothetical protein